MLAESSIHAFAMSPRIAEQSRLLVCAAALVATSCDAGNSAPVHAPEFTHTSAEAWINSPPLKLADYGGRVLLIDVWTFDCWNCYRSIPWLRNVEARLGPKGLALLGVHSPEFAHEHERARVLVKVKEFGIKHPVMLDNDFSYWSALGNRYWPAFYVIDKQGHLRGTFVGETHTGDERAKKIEALIAALLTE